MFLKLNSIVLIFAILFNFSAFAEVKPLTVQDELKLRTVIYTAQNYLNIKNDLDQMVKLKESEIADVADNFSDEAWMGIAHDLLAQKMNETLIANDIQAEELRGKIFLQAWRWTKNQVRLTLNEFKDIGRKEGVGTFIAVVVLNALGYIYPVFFTAIGAPQLASFFTVFPMGTVSSLAFLSLKDKFALKDEKKAFGSKKAFRDYQKAWANAQTSLNLGYKDLVYSVEGNNFAIEKTSAWRKTLNIFGIYNKDLTLTNLKRYLKQNGLWDQRRKDVASSIEFNSEEKTALIIADLHQRLTCDELAQFLNHFDGNLIDKLPVINGGDKLVHWLTQINEVQELEQIPNFMEKAPQVHPFIITSLYENFILPKLSQEMKGLKFRKFHKLFKSTWSLVANAEKSDDEIWDENELFNFRLYFNQSMN
jgi:hypothetical protein